LKSIWKSLVLRTLRRVSPLPRICLFFLLLPSSAVAVDEAMQQELRELRQENRLLRERLDKQQQVIDSLAIKVGSIEQRHKAHEEGPDDATARQTLTQTISTLGKVSIGGQIAAGFFDTGSQGMFPNDEFRVDEARVFLDAQAWQDVYGFVELNVMTREALDDATHLGEAYIDLERLLKWRDLDSLINLRLGRFYTPYGEEYQVRYAIDNPLISHSLADFWGYDNGIELYGSQGSVQYAVAVQNGGVSSLHDFTSDKLVSARLAYEPAKWLRLSASAIRTGDLSAKNDPLSSLWFGNAFFRSLGSPATTTRYHASMAEGDVQFVLARGHLKFAGGAIRYDDNDWTRDNGRDVYYYSAEGMLRFTKQFYGAARFSQIFADNGFPVVGNGTWGEYFYSKLTDNLWRLSLGLGYTPNPNLVFKVEYTLERGTTISGQRREHEDLFGAQAALRF
jgi:hypothetical protein